MVIETMKELYNYFRDLSEGKLDITKTVEYQFIKALQRMDTPIGLEEFASQLNLTSVIFKFIDLTTKAGLLTQSQFGLDTNLHGSIDPNAQTPLEASTSSSSSLPSTPPPVSQPPAATPLDNSIPSSPSSRPPGTPPSAPPSAPSSVSSSTQAPSGRVALKPVPQSETEGMENAFEIDLPGHIKARLNFERAKTGSKKTEDGNDGLNDLFDQLGSLADELDDA